MENVQKALNPAMILIKSNKIQAVPIKTSSSDKRVRMVEMEAIISIQERVWILKRKVIFVVQIAAAAAKTNRFG